EQLRQIEAGINDDILANYPVSTSQQNYKDAIASGVMALFGEKYGDVVRVVAVDDQVSRELCGGTHVSNSGQIGSLLIISEGSVAAGVRRIEAITGPAARKQVQTQLGILNDVAHKLGVKPIEVESRLETLLEQLRERDREIKQLKRKLARSDFEGHLKQVKDINGVQVLAAQVSADNTALMREMSDWFRDKLGSGVIVLGADINNKPALIAAVTDDLVKRGLHAGKLVKAAAQIVGGGGGGRPNMAQAGGKDPSKLPEALRKVEELVAKAV
ncbi:MAG TPA: alanine--tRNA ligase, partial [Chloroflexi bacterium]|nr:alanine--tRNA ligase [Chloroflexota bacterium]